MRTILLIALSFCVCSPSAFAQEADVLHPWLEDDFILSVGGFYPRKEFSVRVDGSVPGRQVDFDKDASVIDDEATGALSFRWKFGEKWSLAGQYYGTGDDARATLQDDVQWRDFVLEAGSNVGAGADLDLIRLFFGREFFTEATDHEFGLGAGLHWLRVSAYLDGEFLANGQSTGFRRESVSADLPLPNVGAWYWHSLSSRWLLTGRVDWFSASIGDYSGSLWNAGVGVNFQAWEHVGFGLSWQYFEIDVDVDKSSWRGNVQLTQDGPFLSMNVNW